MMNKKLFNSVTVLLSGIMLFGNLTVVLACDYYQKEIAYKSEDQGDGEKSSVGKTFSKTIEIMRLDTSANDGTKLSGYDDDLLFSYEKLCEYLDNCEINADISLETFQNEYLNGEYTSLEEYLESYYSLLVTPISDISPLSSTSSDTTWYYNTGTTLYNLPNYTKYNLLNVVQAGDIIYEDEGGSGITGHSSIVEGIYYNSDYGQYYIRIIESIGYISGSGEADGVCHSVFDDNRFDRRGATIFRVSSATTTQKNAAISFCIGQIGKNYVLDLQKDTSSDQADWYCSELVWAAYKNQGINLETSNYEPGVTPHELRDSNLCSKITVTAIGTPTISSFTCNSSTSVTINWGTVSGATGYNVYQSTSATGSYSLVATTTTTSYTNTGLTAGTAYYYRIAAKKGTVIGNKSAVNAVKLSFTAPSIIYITDTSKTGIYLRWSKVYNATGYYVYRATSLTGNYTLIGTTSSCAYIDSKLTTGTGYYYKIAAYNSSGTSSLSTYKYKMPVEISNPVFYYTKANSNSSITLKWTNVPTATTYYIYRSTSSNGTYALVTTTSKTCYTDTGLAASTTYYYKVRASNGNTLSIYSAYKSIKTL